jgi:hypothetical protein
MSRDSDGGFDTAHHSAHLAGGGGGQHASVTGRASPAVSAADDTLPGARPRSPAVADGDSRSAGKAGGSPGARACRRAPGVSADLPRAPFLLDLVSQARAEPYCDVAGVPYLKWPADSTDGAGTPWIAVPMRSRQVQAWLAELYCRHTATLISRAELHQVLLVLEGMAMKHRQADGDSPLEDLIEQDPLLAVLLHFLGERDAWSGTATELLAELRREGARLGARVDRHAGWPADPARLTVRLHRLRDCLRRAGIVYTDGRSAHHRLHGFRKAGDSKPSLPSLPPSLPNSPLQQQIQRGDSGDER